MNTEIARAKLLDLIKDKRFWIVIGLLLLLLGLSYLPFINKAGYIRDDWGTLFVIKQKSIGALFYHFSFDRPFRAYHAMLTARLFGTNLLAYQAFGLLYRGMESLFIFLIFAQLFPKRWRMNATIAALVLVFPGFQDQLHAFDFHVHLFVSMLLKFSVLLSLLAFREKRTGIGVILAIGALGSAAISWGFMEWFIGLEAFRIWVLYMAARQDGRLDGKLAAHSAIYVFSAAVYSYWRLFIFEAQRSSVDGSELLADAGGTTGIGNLLKLLGENVYLQAVAGWFEPLQLQLGRMTVIQIWIGLALAALSTSTDLAANPQIG